MLVWILSWCSRHGRDPFDFYEREFLERPQAWRLMAAYEAWDAKRQETEAERRQRAAATRRP